MNRKLMLLNIALLAIASYAGVQLRRHWQASKERDAAKLNLPVKTLPAPKYQSIEPQPPLIPATYADIAQKMLFDKSRHPNVPVEAPPAPPPPPPMPPLPSFFGMMNLNGPTAILSLGTAPQQAIRPGERIGQFKLVDVNSEGLAFEWNGQTVKKSMDELTRTVPVPTQAQEGRTEAAPPPVEAPRAPLVGPGEDFGGYRNCNVNDGKEEGSVMDGYRKVVYTTPFGKSCRWERVGR